MKKILWLIILLILIFALLQIPSSDDFCNKIQIEKMGSWSYLNHLYFNWTGRYITSIVAIVFFNQLSIEHYNIVSAFNALLFLGSLKFVSKLLVNTKNEIFGILLIFTFFVGARSHIAQFVFWPTGGIVYSFGYLIFFSTLWFIQNPKTHFVFILLLVFVTSFLFETINPAFLVFLYPLLKDERRNCKRLAILFVFGLSSSLLYFAPGNFARANSSGGMSISVVDLILNYFYLLYKSLRYVWGPVTISILVGLLSTSMAMEFKYRILKNRWIFLISALFSLSPFMFVPSQFNGRSSSLFVILISIFFLLSSVCYFNRNKYSFSLISIRFLPFLPCVLMIIFLFDIIRMSEVRASFLSRDKFLKMQKGQFVEVKPLSGELPTSAHFDDINVTEKHWINNCVARYYSLKGIRIQVEK
jgi:hypothetical protein